MKPKKRPEEKQEKRTKKSRYYCLTLVWRCKGWDLCRRKVENWKKKKKNRNSDRFNFLRLNRTLNLRDIFSLTGKLLVNKSTKSRLNLEGCTTKLNKQVALVYFNKSKKKFSVSEDRATSNLPAKTYCGRLNFLQKSTRWKGLKKIPCNSELQRPI